MQRLYTCDNYDHVAIIIKENSKIKIFESTSMGKCSPLSWIHFKMLYFNLVYDKIAYRELIIENKNEEKIIIYLYQNFYAVKSQIIMNMKKNLKNQKDFVVQHWLQLYI